MGGIPIKTVDLFQLSTAYNLDHLASIMLSAFHSISKMRDIIYQDISNFSMLLNYSSNDVMINIFSCKNAIAITKCEKNEKNLNLPS